jgi:hypothetical protein
MCQIYMGVTVINHFLKAAVVCAALSSGVVHASTYDFTYAFADGLDATGTLTGTLSGSNLIDITGETVAFNGVAFNGPLYIGSFAAGTGSYDFSSGAAVASTVAASNNFIIADSNDPQGNGATNYFYFVNGTTPSGSGSQEAVAANGNVLTNNTDIANPALGYAAGTWSLTPAPVPLPAAFPLLLSGLGLLAVKRRRRSAVGA